MQSTLEKVDRRRRVKPRLDRPYAPSVSVVITCYNYERYLPAAVQSCVTQPDVAVDVIIVDDASTDSSPAVAHALAERHPNVSVLAHRDNCGPVEAFNAGARAAKGEFLVRLDADDLLTPGSLSRATLLAQAYPSVGLVYGHPLHFSGKSLPTPRLRASSWTVWPGLEWLSDRCRSGKNVITSPEVLMRRSLVEKLGYMAPLHHSHDMELWLRISAFSDVAYIHGADQAWHRDHPESLSARNVDKLVDLRERVQAFDVLFRGPVADQPFVAALQNMATRTLANEAIATASHELDRGARESALHEYCLDLARELDPTIVQGTPWKKLARRSRDAFIPHSLRMSSLVSRLLGRIKSDLQWHRWHRKGVY